MMVTVAFQPKRTNTKRAARTRMAPITETRAALRLVLRPDVKLARLLTDGVAGRLALADFVTFGDAAAVETLRLCGWIIGCGSRLAAVDGIICVGWSGTGGSISGSSIP